MTTNVRGTRTTAADNEKGIEALMEALFGKKQDKPS
jgi:hypothetical protein